MIYSMTLGLGPCKLHLSCHLAPCWALPIGGARERATASLERGGIDPFDLLADTFRVFSVMVLLSGISSFCFFNLSPPFFGTVSALQGSSYELLQHHQQQAAPFPQRSGFQLHGDCLLQTFRFQQCLLCPFVPAALGVGHASYNYSLWDISVFSFCFVALRCLLNQSPILNSLCWKI